jgi:glycosyltransferase involved in cell wall biosynthesis
MAQLPHFVFSPSTLLSVVGLLRGRETDPPREAWRDAKVAVVIPALNEQENIVYCLASVLRQTLWPHRIVVVDDGSTDATSARARAFAGFHGADVVVIQRSKSIGKTPSLKEQARSLDSDVLFVLDADTVLESDTYIARTVEELYQGAGIASAWGSVLPLRERDRQVEDESAATQAFRQTVHCEQAPPANRLRRFARAVTNTYREVLYVFLQRIVFQGQMALFGTVSNPAGCAVAYRRAYLEALFDAVEPRLGDDLTNSEDIFIGFAMLNEGYRNIQVLDVVARTVEPEVQRLPRQLNLWSSAFLQSAFYFNGLLESPFKALKRRRLARRRPGGSAGRLQPVAAAGGSGAHATAAYAPAPQGLLSSMTDRLGGMPGPLAPAGPATVVAASLPGGERRRIQEAYRQAFGHVHTRNYGRPAGWTLLSSAIEKIGFPIVMILMAYLGNWEAVLITIGAETFLFVAALTVVMKGRRLQYVAKGLAVTPVRYALLISELVTIARFASDLWLTGNRRWRK